MPCNLPKQKLQDTIAFHGHSCPGLTIGMRAAEFALRELPQAKDMVAVVETDMCGVDAIQFLTGCTYGKGNLIHRDLGKMAFSFHDRGSGKGFRLRLRPEVRADMDGEMGPLMAAMAAGTATDEQKHRSAELRQQLQARYMDLELEEMFDILPMDQSAPRPAKILQSLVCDACGESTMESRTRRFAGQTLCIPCFAEVEQKV